METEKVDVLRFQHLLDLLNYLIDNHRDKISIEKEIFYKDSKNKLFKLLGIFLEPYVGFHLYIPALCLVIDVSFKEKDDVDIEVSLRDDCYIIRSENWKGNLKIFEKVSSLEKLLKQEKETKETNKFYEKIYTRLNKIKK